MGEVEDFPESVLPRLKAADTALHNGDAGPRIAMWSERDPVTLFGAVMTKTGWTEIRPAFEWLATQFSNCEFFEYEVVAADASGNLGYVVGIEHTTVSIGGRPPQRYALRVTTIVRRERDVWKVVHRHSDQVPDSGAAREQLAQLKEK